MTKLFLSESILAERKPVLTESAGGFVYLKGLFLEGEVQNHNGRRYPREEIANAVARMNQHIQEKGPIPGELDHPEGLNINYDRIRHLITHITVEGANGIGTMKVINAGLGLIVKGTVEAGMQVGVSSRGSGNVGGNGVVSEFDIVTIDIVANPSAPNALPRASLSEALMANPHGREALTLSQWAHNDPEAQKYLTREINKFLVDIRDRVTWRRK